jgi:hypothetical protein
VEENRIYKVDQLTVASTGNPRREGLPKFYKKLYIEFSASPPTWDLFTCPSWRVS